MFKRGMQIAMLAASGLGLAATGGYGFGRGGSIYELRALEPDQAPLPVRRRVKRSVGPGASRKYRNRWKAARPNRHRNLQHVSKRTRRKHRRAKHAA